MRRRLVLVGLAGVYFCAFAGAALSGNGGLAPQHPESPNAQGILDTYWLLLGISGAVFVVVETALIVFIVRFRSRGRGREVEGPQITGHTRLEIMWTVIPVLLLAAIVSFVFYKLPGIKDVPAARAGEQRLAITVQGHQFYWRFVYPDGTVAIDTLTVPVGQVVTLSIVSRDVAHSWWVPALGGKTDAIPGRTNHTWFQALKAGVYEGQCAEFCGIQHAAMTDVVHVVSQPEYDAWLRRQHASAAELGQQEFVGVCAKCHGFAGQGGIGPKLAGTTVVPKDLAKTIREGVGMMPAVAANWDARQVNAVIEYIRAKVANGG